jgi:hypothetical protein
VAGLKKDPWKKLEIREDFEFNKENLLGMGLGRMLSLHRGHLNNA